MSKSEIIISTTDSIPGYETVKLLGPPLIAEGGGFLSSGVESATRDANDGLVAKAQYIGANALLGVGYSVYYRPVSRDCLVTAYGTPAKVGKREP